MSESVKSAEASWPSSKSVGLRSEHSLSLRALFGGSLFVMVVAGVPCLDVVSVSSGGEDASGVISVSGEAGSSVLEAVAIVAEGRAS